MKYLTIIRHAKSSWDDPSREDIDRPLNARGKKAIEIMGAYLKDKKIIPDRVLSSPAVRALKTAAGISKWVNYPPEKIKTEKAIYFGSIPELTDIISGLPEKNSDVFLFGHEPLLSSLVFRLTGNELPKFPTCAVYRIRWEIKKWQDTRTQKGHCEFFVYPKMLAKE